jgi:hypothetical protein
MFFLLLKIESSTPALVFEVLATLDAAFVP